jgi:OOP family OmpA-OmpF porin
MDSLEQKERKHDISKDKPGKKPETSIILSTYVKLSKMLKHLLLVVAMFTCISLYSQKTQFPWEFGLQLGTSSLGGDMIENDIILLNAPSFSAGVMVRRRLGGMFALRAHIMYGGLNSDDADGENGDRGFSSEATVIEPGLVLEFEPFAANRFKDGVFKKTFSPYIGVGAAYGIWGDVTTNYNGTSNAGVTADIAAQADDNGGVVFPIGGGLKYYLSPKSSLGFDISYRMTGADLIDGVSESGNPAKDDAYTMLGLTFSTGFGKPDTDKDGIYDEEDACPTEAGPISTMGCPDGDGDGVADKDDKCPTEAGVAALMGCPDGDGDGIADGDDDCPAEAGTAANGGCPDRDGDGIIDKEDECPDVAGVAARNGCPEPKDRAETLPERVTRYSEMLDTMGFEYIRVDSTRGTIDIDRIYFPTNISRLNRPDRVIIEEIDRFIALPGASEFSIRFEGHADRRSSDEYNQGLSERRAGSAEKYSVDKGATPDKLSMIGFGEQRPVGETLRENRVVIPVASEPTRMIKVN